jgi:hypothetical protein
MLRGALVCVLVIGCHEAAPGKSRERSDVVAPSAAGARAGSSLYTRDTLDKVVNDVLGRFSASVGILSIEILPDQARFEVEAPATPGDVVEYAWRAGEVRGPSRLEIRGKGSLQQNLFLASSLEFAAIPSLVELARTRVDAEQGVISRVLIRRNLPADDGVGIRVYVDSPIRSSHVDADAHGRLVEPGKYP